MAWTAAGELCKPRSRGSDPLTGGCATRQPRACLLSSRLTTLRLPDERWGESQPARSQIPRLVLSNEVDAKGNAHVNDTALKQLVAAAQAGDEKALEAKEGPEVA